MRKSGLAIVLLLVVGLLAALLAAGQMRRLRPTAAETGASQSAVEQAQDVVDALNDRLAQAGEIP